MQWAQKKKLDSIVVAVSAYTDLDEELAAGTGFEAEEEEEEKLPSGFQPGKLTEGTKLYIGNLPWSCDSQNLAEIFQDYGEVELVEIMYDRESGRSRGFGFITMATAEGADLACKGLNGAELGGRVIRVNYPEVPKGNFGERRERSPRREFSGRRDFGSSGGRDMNAGSGNRLYVGNIPWSLDDAGLGRIFSNYGQVVDSKVVFDRESGRSRGFGFVTYSSQGEANTAISSLDGADYEGRALKVSIAGERPPRRDSY